MEGGSGIVVVGAGSSPGPRWQAARRGGRRARARRPIGVAGGGDRRSDGRLVGRLLGAARHRHGCRHATAAHRCQPFTRRRWTPPRPGPAPGASSCPHGEATLCGRGRRIPRCPDPSHIGSRRPVDRAAWTGTPPWSPPGSTAGRGVAAGRSPRTSCGTTRPPRRRPTASVHACGAGPTGSPHRRPGPVGPSWCAGPCGWSWRGRWTPPARPSSGPASGCRPGTCGGCSPSTSGRHRTSSPGPAGRTSPGGCSTTPTSGSRTSPTPPGSAAPGSSTGPASPSSVRRPGSCGPGGGPPTDWPPTGAWRCGCRSPGRSTGRPCSTTSPCVPSPGSRPWPVTATGGPSSSTATPGFWRCCPAATTTSSWSPTCPTGTG